MLAPVPTEASLLLAAPEASSVTQDESVNLEVATVTNHGTFPFFSETFLSSGIFKILVSLCLPSVSLGFW